MPQLNDTQSILLSKAAQRGDYSLYPLADGHARAGARINKAIAELMGALLVEERETNIAAQVSRSDGDLRYGLYATASGLAAIGIEPEAAEPGEQGTEPTIDSAPAADRPRATKSAAVIALMSREQGATLAELINPAETQPVTWAGQGDPRALLMVGEEDRTVMPRNSEALASRLNAGGSSARIIRYPGLGHIGMLTALARTLRGKANVLGDIADFSKAVTGP